MQYRLVQKVHEYNNITVKNKIYCRGLKILRWKIISANKLIQYEIALANSEINLILRGNKSFL